VATGDTIYSGAVTARALGQDGPWAGTPQWWATIRGDWAVGDYTEIVLSASADFGDATLNPFALGQTYHASVTEGPSAHVAGALFQRTITVYQANIERPAGNSPRTNLSNNDGPGAGSGGLSAPTNVGRVYLSGESSAQGGKQYTIVITPAA
jgi:hypothetical protein